MKIGKLKEVDVRELWKHEQYDFSDWLAKEENIELDWHKHSINLLMKTYKKGENLWLKIRTLNHLMLYNQL